MSSATWLQRMPAAPMRHQKLRGEISANLQPAWLSRVIHDTIHRCRGLAKVIAAELGVHERRVWALADEGQHVALKAYEIPPMVKATRDFAILDALEAQVGRVAFRLSVDGPADDLHRKLSAAVRQFGEFLEVAGEAIEDGRLAPAEVPPVLKEIDELIAALCEYRARVVASVHTADSTDEPWSTVTPEKGVSL